MAQRMRLCAPKLAKGEIGALTGAQDDPRYFQISVPLQPGSSCGPLVDERGNAVIRIVSASGSWSFSSRNLSAIRFTGEWAFQLVIRAPMLARIRPGPRNHDRFRRLRAAKAIPYQ